jgi:hypothetical protein
VVYKQVGEAGRGCATQGLKGSSLLENAAKQPKPQREATSISASAQVPAVTLRQRGLELVIEYLECCPGKVVMQDAESSSSCDPSRRNHHAAANQRKCRKNQITRFLCKAVRKDHYR